MKMLKQALTPMTIYTASLAESPSPSISYNAANALSQTMGWDAQK